MIGNDSANQWDYLGLKTCNVYEIDSLTGEYVPEGEGKPYQLPDFVVTVDPKTGEQTGFPVGSEKHADYQREQYWDYLREYGHLEEDSQAPTVAQLSAHVGKFNPVLDGLAIGSIATPAVVYFLGAATALKIPPAVQLALAKGLELAANELGDENPNLPPTPVEDPPSIRDEPFRPTPTEPADP